MCHGLEPKGVDIDLAFLKPPPVIQPFEAGLVSKPLDRSAKQTTAIVIRTETDTPHPVENRALIAVKMDHT
jgi:hypothetical protein